MTMPFDPLPPEMRRGKDAEIEKLRAAAWLNGLERDEANDRLEQLRDGLQSAYDRAGAMLESSEKHWLRGTLDDLLRLARPAQMTRRDR